MNMYERLPRSKFAEFVFADTRVAPLWLMLRVYIGYVWLEAGLAKFTNPAWVGDHTGTAITGYLANALTKTAGAHPDVLSWYAWFIEHVALAYPTLFSYLITYGELCVGLGLIVGAFTGLAAFFGMLMNLNFLLSGSTGINPPFVIVELLLLLAWRTSGYWGADRYLLPYLSRKRKVGRSG